MDRPAILSLAVFALLLGSVSSVTYTRLTDGIPLAGYVAREEWAYYDVELPTASPFSSLVVTVTPTADGDPDLYLSLTDPVDASAQWSARGWGTDSVTIHEADYRPSSGPAFTRAFIGVRGFLNCNYTILAHLKAVITLREGVPQSGEVARSATDAYKLEVSHPHGHGDLTVIATPLIGSVLVFVGTERTPAFGDPSSYQWSSHEFQQGQALVISRSDPKWPAGDPAVFHISVYGLTESRYQLVAAGNRTAIVLRDGVPIQDHINAGEMEYYKMSVANPGCQLKLDVTPISGDPDLYLSRLTQTPGPDNYEKMSRAWGADQIVWDDAPVADYYLGVTAFTSTTFTLVGTVRCNGGNNTYLYLVDGVPQSGMIGTGELMYYRIDVKDTHADLSISVTRRWGDPDIYVRNDGRDPSPRSWQWRSNAFGEDLVTIYHDDPQFRAPATYLIAVYAFTNTSFTIRATTSHGITLLQEGVPVRESLRKGAYDYFRFQVAHQVKELTVTVTDLGTGDPDLFISTEYSRPNMTHYTWRAQQLSTDSITIPHTDPHACTLCTYYISVYAYQATTFTIVAYTDDVVSLQDGIPQSGVVPRGGYRYYDMNLHDPSKDLTITLSSMSGLVSMYVSTSVYPMSGDPSTYDWFAPWYSSAKSIVIRSTDEKACRSTDCTYHIGVYGVNNASYAIIAATADATIPLQNGVPQREHVETGKWQYFSIRVDNPDNALSIVVTPFTGDPDLYVSHYTQRPNETSYEKQSSRYGADSVDFEPAAVATYYIGVKAYTNSTFSIVAVITPAGGNDTSVVTRLLDGEPQQGVVRKDHYHYYRIQIEEGHEDLMFVLTRNYGDPDIYITADGSFPTRNHYTWSSLSTETDVVRISEPRGGMYMVGVFGYQTSGYSLLARTSAIIVSLQDGVPQRGELVAHQYAYYSLFVDRPDKDITVTVTPFSGDPDLFISTIVHNPTMQNYTWMAMAYRDDSITIPRTDPNFCYGCTYYIGVYSFTACSYSILATFDEEAHLVEGEPQSGQVAKGALHYYRFQMAGHRSDLTISVTPQSGQASLYVTTGVHLPTTTDYHWRAISFGGSVSMVIHAGEPHYCSGSQCFYNIGVYGLTATHYSIVATTSEGWVNLQDGIPFHDWVQPGRFRHFMFTLLDAKPGSSLAVTLTALSGDPDLYISRQYWSPNRTHNEWSSRAIGDDAILIEPVQRGTYYMAVEGYVNSTFSIAAYLMDNSQNRTLLLVDGQPQSGVVGQGKYAQYHFDLAEPTRALTVTVTRRMGDPDIYITNDGTVPSKSNYKWSSTAWGEDLVRIRAPAVGDYRIAVHGFSTSSYTIVASTADTILQLSEGVPFRGELEAGQYEYFKFHVPRNDQDLTVTVTALNGDPDLFMSDEHERPNMTHYKWAARSYREDSITLPRSRMRVGWYYISVLAFTPATITIVATLLPEIELQPGQPQSGVVQYEAGRYYGLYVGEQYRDLTFTLTPLSGNAWMYISRRGEPVHTDPSSYQWASTQSGEQTVVVRRTDPHWCYNCKYTVLVWGASQSVFNLLAASPEEHTRLVDGVPQRGWTDEGHSQYFAFDLRLPKAALSIVVSPLTGGDPDLFVSTTEPYPSSETHTWSSMAYGADAVNIDYKDPNYKVGLYYISVYGWRNTTFSILASVTDLSRNDTSDYIALINGQPQIGFLEERGRSKHYMFIMSGTVRRDVTFTVTPRYGDPDLYIRNDGLRPTPSFYQWSSRQWGKDEVTIHDSCLQCNYTILVEAFSKTLYSIVATTSDAHTRLQSGVPFQGDVKAGKIKYFVMDVDTWDQELVISTTALSGDPDIYISETDTNPWPNATHHDYSALDFGSDVFTIPRPKFGKYYIGIHGFTDTSFLLTATIGSITLLPDKPYDDKMRAGEIRYYAFTMEDRSRTQDLTFSINLNDQSEIAFYVSNNNSKPTKGSHQWASTDPSSSGLRNTITISHKDRKACFDCTYYVAVYALPEYWRTSYTITAEYGQGTILLRDGVPATGSVKKAEWRYFRGIVGSDSRDINIDATTFLGDIELFVKFGSRPNETDFGWRSGHNPASRGDHIDIPKTDPGFKLGVYFIGVKSYAQESRFSLVMSTGAIVLRAGVPQVGTVEKAGTFYSLTVDLKGKPDIMFQVSSFDSGSEASDIDLMFYLVNVTAPYGSPGPKDWPPIYQWRQRMTDGSFLRVQSSHRAYCSVCTYTLGIWPDENAMKSGTHFTLTASVAESYDVLFDNSAVRNAIPAKGWKYYEIYVPSSTSFRIILESCTGNADIYVSQTTFKPGPGNSNWASTSKTDIDEVLIEDPSLKHSTFYIGVFAESGDEQGQTNYLIRTLLSKPVPPPVPGGNGRLQALPALVPGAISFEFESATAADGGDLNYTIYYARSATKAVMYSYCGLERATAYKSFKGTGQDTIKQTVYGLAKGTSYDVNVLVRDAKGAKKLYQPTAFKTATDEDVPSGDGGRTLGLVFAIGIPLAIVVAIGCIYLVVKNRKLTKELEVEMHDVPKAAVRKAVKGPQGEVIEQPAGGQSQKYHKLLTDDDPDEYAPPDLSSHEI